MIECHSSNVARNSSYQVQIEDIVDDDRPPRGRIGLRITSLENDKSMSSRKILKVLYCCSSGTCVEWFSDKDGISRLETNQEEYDVFSCECRAGCSQSSSSSRTLSREYYRSKLTCSSGSFYEGSQGKQRVCSEHRRRLDWNLVVRYRDNMCLSGYQMETDARDDLEAKKFGAM